MKTTYRIIEKPPYDEGSLNTFWIKRETKLFGLIINSKMIGNYKIDNTYGELGEMPFFNKKSAKKRLKILKNN